MKEIVKARCRCGAVRFSIPREFIFNIDECHCAFHGGRGGPPFLVNALFPLHCLKFYSGFEFSGALLGKFKNKLKLNSENLCVVCGDTLIIDDIIGITNHVFRASFKLINEPKKVEDAIIELYLWTGKQGTAIAGSGILMRNQKEVDKRNK